VTKFFQSSLRLIHLLNQDVQINDVVLALLGDFITNDIHEELKDLNAASTDQRVGARTGTHRQRD
jgi:hypothetical protein